MSTVVVDASVEVKWFVPEVHAAEARQWRNGPDELHVPAFFFDLEIANILWKKVRRAEITRADADLILAQLPAPPHATPGCPFTGLGLRLGRPHPTDGLRLLVPGLGRAIGRADGDSGPAALQ